MKKDCYLFNVCSLPIKKENRSCYNRCSIYSEWSELISAHDELYDKTTFDVIKTSNDLEKIPEQTERLRYWISNHWYPLYERFDKIEFGDRQNLINYQNSIKYSSDDFFYGSLYIPNSIRQYFEQDQSHEFRYELLKFYAEQLHRNLLDINWKDKLNSPARILTIKRELKLIDDSEKEAEKNYSEYNKFDIDDVKISPNNKYINQIEIVRIKVDYYKKNNLEDLTGRTCELYARHIFFKNYLENIQDNKINIQSKIRPKVKVSYRQIAIFYWYMSKYDSSYLIDSNNCTQIATEFGYNARTRGKILMRQSRKMRSIHERFNSKVFDKKYHKILTELLKKNSKALNDFNSDLDKSNIDIK